MSSFNLKRSYTLPLLMDHSILRKGHPIMSCLADQTRYDLNWKNCCFTAETLLEAILINLVTGKVVWPGVGSFKSKDDWIKNMRENPYWYVLNNVGEIDHRVINEADDLLFNLASNYLQRQIQLIPMLGKGFKKFGNNFSSVNTYRLLYCHLAGFENFFISVK